MAIVEGQQAPAFKLTDASGKPVTLDDFAGRNLVLYFYPRDDTPGCTKEACSFRDLWAELTEIDALVVGISPDDAASHRQFADKYRLPFTLLCDPDRSMMTAYEAYGEKMMYGKKTRGVIRSTVWIGPDGTVRKHWRKVANAAEHPAAVIQALRDG